MLQRDKKQSRYKEKPSENEILKALLIWGEASIPYWEVGDY
jgi:hypothetical protein